MSGDDSGSLRRLRVDVAAAVRRVERRLTVRLVATWVTVFALTAGLVMAGVLVREYIQSLMSSWRLLTISLLWLFVAIGVFLSNSLARPTILSHRPNQTRTRVRRHSWVAAVRRFALGFPPAWLIILAVTMVLVTAGVVALAYVRLPTTPSQLGSPSPPLLLVGAVVLLAGALARIALRTLRRSRGRVGELPEDFRVEPHPRPVEVTVEYVRDDTRTFTVRLEPHPDPGNQTLWEVNA